MFYRSTIEPVRRHLTLQIFLAMALAVLVGVVSLYSILLPTLEARSRTHLEALAKARHDQANQVTAAAIEFLDLLDQWALRYQQPELDVSLAGVLQQARLLEQQIVQGTIERDVARAKLKQVVESWPGEGMHHWLADAEGNWVYHLRGDPYASVPSRQARFRAFIQTTVAQGRSSQALPWEAYGPYDVTPTTAVWLPELGWVLGVNGALDQLESSHLPEYQVLVEQMRAKLQQTRADSEGLVFLFLPDNRYLVGKYWFNMGRRLQEQRNPLTGKLFIDEFRRAAAEGDGQVEVLWDRVDEPDNLSYPAMATVSHYASRDIYLVSIVYESVQGDSLAQLRNLLLLAAASCLLFGLLMAAWLTRWLVRPIRQLSGHAQRIGQGELHLRSNITREDEIGVLAIEFDQMVQRLQQTIDSLDGQVQQRTEQLACQNARLEASLEQKEFLLREIHHRVKNNLAVILGFIKLQQRRCRGSETDDILQELRNRIYAIELIHRILYQAPEPDKLDVADYLQRLTAEIESLYGRNARIALELDVQIEQMGLEELLACGLLINELLSNAFKHAFEEADSGEIQVSLKPQDGQVCLTVEDNGCGLINQDWQQGSGLGMTLVRNLAQGRLRGELSQLRSQGQGTCWQVVF